MAFQQFSMKWHLLPKTRKTAKLTVLTSFHTFGQNAVPAVSNILLNTGPGSHILVLASHILALDHPYTGPTLPPWVHPMPAPVLMPSRAVRTCGEVDWAMGL